MSLRHRQSTCAACGKPFTEDQPTNIEPLIDDGIRYVVVCWGCTTHPAKGRDDEQRAS